MRFLKDYQPKDLKIFFYEKINIVITIALLTNRWIHDLF